jgi:uncharacterized protein YndB with AHSA1/START domain
MTQEKTLNEAIVLERTYDAPVNAVWQALTDKNKMKQWYFDIKDFKPEVGHEFQFYAGDDKKQYLHICVIKEVIPQKKISYTWKYDYDPNVTLVSFELFPDGQKTKLRLTHEGIDNFSKDHPEFARKNFLQGWTGFVDKELKEFLEKDSL